MKTIFYLFVMLSAISLRAEEEKSQLDAPYEHANRDPSALRILFIGNSITRHAANESTKERLGWTHVSGMAASEESKDYVHLLAARVGELVAPRKVEIDFHTGGGSGSVAHRLGAIDEVLPLQPHIVVIQLGEHEKETDGVDGLRENYRKLITAFDLQDNPPLVVCVGPWSPGQGGAGRPRYTGWAAEIEETFRSVAEQAGKPFVSVAGVARNPNNFGSGETSGVRWHPNDGGHEGYARAIFPVVSDFLSKAEVAR
jgi:hypothetical protein